MLRAEKCNKCKEGAKVKGKKEEEDMIEKRKRPDPQALIDDEALPASNSPRLYPLKVVNKQLS